MELTGLIMVPWTDGGTPGVRLAPGVVEISGARIGRVLLADRADDADGLVILPGLLDAHCHLPQFDSVGAAGLPLLNWLEAVVFPAEARWEDSGFAERMTRRVGARLIRNGTTGIVTYGTVHARAVRAAIGAIRESGLRAAVGQTLMDRGAPAGLLRPAAQLLEEAASLLFDFPVGGRVESAVTPRFALSCTEELLNGAGALAIGSKSRPIVQTHLAETRDECRIASELFGGARYADIYDRAGLLTDRTVLGHCVWLEDADRSLLRSRGSIVAHCPTANLFLGSGSMHLAEVRASGVTWTLGSDVAGGPDVSMVRVARAAMETSVHLKLADAEWRGTADAAMTPTEAWWAISGGNAGALGWSDSGRIADGCCADLVVVRPEWGCDALTELAGGHGIDDPGVQHRALSWLLYAWTERWIERVLLEGQVRFDAATGRGG